MDRRTFIIMGSATTAALTGCSALDVDPDTGGQDTGPVDTTQKQEPMLQKLVDDGKLPDLTERLPANPFVVPVQQLLGQYGGTMRRGQANPGETGSNYMTFAGIDLGPPVRGDEAEPSGGRRFQTDVSFDHLEPLGFELVAIDHWVPDLSRRIAATVARHFRAWPR